MQEKNASQSEKDNNGIVVWDQRGLVVMWPDRSANRFSWETLRHISLCAECQKPSPHSPLLLSSSLN